jgi:thiol-disulfide isomerase/thioredoxin
MDFFGIGKKPLNPDAKYFEIKEECMTIQDKRFKKGKKVVCGLVFANWCGHCMMLKPKWRQMVDNIRKKVKSNVYHEPMFLPFEDSKLDKLREFNENNAVYLNGEKVSHEGFPTLFKIDNGKIEYYTGSREPEAMEKWYMMNNMNSNYKIVRVKHFTRGRAKRRSNKNRTRNNTKR